MSYMNNNCYLHKVKTLLKPIQRAIKHETQLMTSKYYSSSFTSAVRQRGRLLPGTLLRIISFDGGYRHLSPVKVDFVGLVATHYVHIAPGSSNCRARSPNLQRTAGEPFVLKKKIYL